MVGVAAIAFILAVTLIVNVQVSFAQESTIVENFTDAIVPDNNEEEETTTQVDVLLGQLNATIAAISTLVATAIGIVTYIVAAVRSRTGDRIISKDAENKFLDIVAQVRQKDNELRDVYRQVLEQKETINVAMGIIKTNSPEVGNKLDETLPKVNETIGAKILPQIQQWQTQADDFYETLLAKRPIGTK